MRITDILIYENDDFVVLNKPSGLLSIPDREGKDISLKKILQEKYDQIFTIHRLDKGTSGLILFAKNEATHKFLSQQFVPKDSPKESYRTFGAAQQGINRNYQSRYQKKYTPTKNR